MKYLNKLQVFGYLRNNFDRTAWPTASKFSKINRVGKGLVSTGQSRTHPTPFGLQRRNSDW